MKKKFVLLAFLWISIIILVACNNSTSTNSTTDTSTLPTNTVDTNNPTAKGLDTASESKISVEACATSWWKLDELWALISSHDQGTDTTTYVGFDFIPSTPPLKFKGELFNVDPIWEDTKPYNKRVVLQCNDPRTTVTPTSHDDRGHYIRRLIIGINDFRNLLKQNTDGNYNHYRLLIKPHGIPDNDNDDTGDYINASILLLNTTNNKLSASTNLHPCPKCSGTSLEEFLKKK